MAQKVTCEIYLMLSFVWSRLYIYFGYSFMLPAPNLMSDVGPNKNKRLVQHLGTGTLKMKPSLFNDFLFGLHLNNVPDWFFIDAAAVPINYKYKDAASIGSSCFMEGYGGA
jgi:hypothetical protein